MDAAVFQCHLRICKCVSCSDRTAPKLMLSDKAALLLNKRKNPSNTKSASDLRPDALFILCLPQNLIHLRL